MTVVICIKRTIMKWTLMLLSIQVWICSDLHTYTSFPLPMLDKSLIMISASLCVCPPWEDLRSAHGYTRAYGVSSGWWTGWWILVSCCQPFSGWKPRMSHITDVSMNAILFIDSGNIRAPVVKARHSVIVIIGYYEFIQIPLNSK